MKWFCTRHKVAQEFCSFSLFKTAPMPLARNSITMGGQHSP